MAQKPKGEKEKMGFGNWHRLFQAEDSTGWDRMGHHADSGQD